MKKFLSVILSVFCLLSLFGCNSTQEDEWTGKISNNVHFWFGDDNSKIWLDNSYIEKISLETNENGEKNLVFTTTEEGKALLYNATEENIGNILSAGVDKYLLFSATVAAPIENGVFVMNGNTLQDYTYIYNYLTGAKDKMKGVTPPDYLIDEDTAKNKVFQSAEVTADEVTKLSVELKFDEDYFGWKYCINFTANDQNYVTEVNAHTGGIIKFW